MSQRSVVLALFRSALRSARQYERNSVRALTESELIAQLDDLRVLREKASGGPLLSQLICTDFKSNREAEPAAVDALVDRGFLALRKLDSLNQSAQPPEPRAARRASSAFTYRVDQAEWER